MPPLRGQTNEPNAQTFIKKQNNVLMAVVVLETNPVTKIEFPVPRVEKINNFPPEKLRTANSFLIFRSAFQRHVKNGIRNHNISGCASRAWRTASKEFKMAFEEVERELKEVFAKEPPRFVLYEPGKRARSRRKKPKKPKKGNLREQPADNSVLGDERQISPAPDEDSLSGIFAYQNEGEFVSYDDGYQSMLNDTPCVETQPSVYGGYNECEIPENFICESQQPSVYNECELPGNFIFLT